MTRRGSSGAVIELDVHTVTKSHETAGGRLLAQYDWLRVHQSTAVPTVTVGRRLVNETRQILSYDMERLVRPPTWALNHDTVMSGMIEQLRRHIWSQAPEVKFSYQDLYVKLGNISTQHGMSLIRARLHSMLDTVRWDDLPACLTHGDPTFDNVMFREQTGELVLIDPIPATSAVPDLRCVDLGKILQSIVGFERVRYGNITEMFTASAEDLRQHAFNYNEWRASVLWCIIHLMRAFPYVPSTTQAGLRMCIEDAFNLL